MRVNVATKLMLEDMKRRIEALEAALQVLADRVGPVATERVNKTLKLPEKRKSA